MTWIGPFIFHKMGGEGNDETPVGEGARRDPTGSEYERGGLPAPHRKVFKCGIAPIDTTSISRASKGMWFFIPLMSGLCLECLGDETRRVISCAALLSLLITDPNISKSSLPQSCTLLKDLVSN